MLRRIRMSHGSVGVWLLTGVAAILAVAALTHLGWERPPHLSGPTVPWWALAIAFGLTEIFVIHLRIARDAHSFSLSEIPLVIGLAHATPGGLVLAQVLGVGLALTLHRRQRSARTAFNLAQRSFTGVLAIALFLTLCTWLGDTWAAVCAAAFIATLTADVVSAILINLAMSLSAGGGRIFDQVVGPGTIFTVASTGIALVCLMVMAVDPLGLVLVSGFTITTFFAARAYSDIQRKHEDLETLQRATRLAETSLELEHMLPTLLEHVRQMFHADIAELILCPAGLEDGYLTTQLGPGDERSLLRPTALDPAEGVWARVSSEREGVLLARPIRNPALAEHFKGRGIDEAIVVPMISEGDVIGVLTAANRVGDFVTFDEHDVRLLQVVANHLSVSVRNGRLLERIGVALAHEREVVRRKDDLVSRVSNELRPPLTNLQGYVKTLLNPDVNLTSDERQEFLSSADRQVELLCRLIEELLFTPLAVTESMPDDEPISLRDLIQQIAEDRAGPDRAGRLEFMLSEDLPMARTRVDELSRLIGNLVDNALKYSPVNTPVRVGARLESIGVRVSVIDHGPGIPVEASQRIFERFYQVDRDRVGRSTGGGMGLYICRRAADALGARVWLDRSNTNGSIFCAWLPLERTPRDARRRELIRLG